MEKKYVSTDIEYSGDSKQKQWQGSILSLGSCVVWDINTAFYREIQPINDIYNENAMMTISPQFQFLWDISWLTWREILGVLKEKGISPQEFISSYKEWLDSLWNQRLVELASPIKFDGWLLAYYFRQYWDENPLGFSWIDSKSMLQWFLSDPNINFKKILWSWELPHHALRDSQIQAVEAEMLFKMMQDVRQWADYQHRYARSKEHFESSQQVKNIIVWAKDTISSIRNTWIWEQVQGYRTIL